MRLLYLTSLLAITTLANVSANDSTAAFGVGGLVFTKSDHIVMQEEDLFISKDKIRIAYKFYNTSDKPITTRVAFPLPEIVLDADNSAFPDYTEADLRKDKNILKFSVVVDGKKQVFQSEDKKRFDQDAQAYVHKITHYWMQTFPAKKVILVNHEYTPGVGGGVGYGLQGEESGIYCIDKSTKAWINNQLKAKYDIPTSTITYILKTGANWKGAIGKFKLTIKKSDSNEKLSFCGSEVKKIDDKTFVMEKINFIPKNDLNIIYFGIPYKIGE
ncbi:DUF4424 family protein [Thiolinea disciformis]|uniref:DUF4424 family protein n=1 Tax=Thiolinea disciformis TaxID=125614 RepID=UPI0003A29733|nr:DUF4424 family protein [Thiolinea disciformis]